MNWVGWRLITWDLTVNTGLYYPWLGGSGAIPASDPLVLKGIHTQTATNLEFTSGNTWISQVQAVRLGDFIAGDTPTGINNNLEENNIIVYVANDYIQVSSLETIKTIELYSLVGALLKSVQPEQNLYQFSTNDLTQGAYILRVTTEASQKNVNVIVR